MCEEKPQVEEIMSYKCNWCGNLYNDKLNANKCAFKHAQTNLANQMLNDGCNLRSIEYQCGFHWNLTQEQEEITKDNCFIISHWECCNKPAYRITRIEDYGTLYLCGVGSWAGGYGNRVSINNLPIPHPKEEFYIYKR
jgi:hypothetical protein